MAWKGVAHESNYEKSVIGVVFLYCMSTTFNSMVGHLRIIEEKIFFDLFYQRNINCKSRNCSRGPHDKVNQYINSLIPYPISWCVNQLIQLRARKEKG